MSINNLNTYLNIRDAHLRVVSGNVYAQAMNIGGINVETAHGLQSVSNTGNATSLTLEFANVTTGFVTTANAQIGRDLVVTGNATISKELTVTSNAIVSSNLNVSDDLVVTNNILASNNLTVTGNLNVTTVMSDSNVVIEYTGPHDRPLRKYPEVAMATGQGDGYTQDGYTVEESSNYGAASHKLSNAFDHKTGSVSPSDSWLSGQNTYANDGTALNASSPDTFQSIKGSWIGIRLPKKIKLSHIHLYNLDFSATANRPPKTGIVWASNNSGSSWNRINDFSCANHVRNGLNTVNVNSATYYDWYRVQITEMVIDGTYTNAVSLQEVEFYGYEEGSGSLDTTLKTVYNVPATTGTQLEVYYDAKGESTVQSPIPDLSPNTNTGALSTSPPTLDETDGIDSFKFNGSSQYITSTHGLSVPGQPVHSQCVWFKITGDTGDYQYISVIGTTNQTNQAGLVLLNDGKTLLGNYYGGDRVITTITQNVWYHAVLVYTGTTTDAAKYYINGVEVITTEAVEAPITPTITGTTLRLGANTTGGQELNGSIANFRLYSKALNADQVKELYDYQKDYFFGSKSQVTLYKGHLGVGVTEPSGQLELAGDERIQEYPPGPLTNYDTHIPGHGVFKVYASTNGAAASGYQAWKAFNKIVDGLGWHDDGAPYTNGLYTGTQSLAGIKGEWIVLKLPYAINLKSAATAPRSGQGFATRGVGAGVILGSNDGNNWDHLHSFSGLTATDYTFTYINNITAPGYYTTFAFLVTELAGAPSSTNTNSVNISEIKFFGTPGPTTLDKGSLSLTRSLDVPRVSRYDVDTETPRPEKLLLDYDTTVNSSLTDISGKGNHGTFFDDAQYSSADKAFKFDGTDDYTKTDITIAGGNMAWTQSMWFKINAFPASSSTYAVLSFFGNKSSLSGHIMSYKNNEFWQDWYGNGVKANYTLEVGKWYHVVSVYHGNTDTDANVRSSIYINGVKQTLTWYSQISSQMTLPTSTSYELADYINAVNVRHNGWISNPKFYTVALEPSEVKKLYNLGRTGRSMVISDTAVGIGKVPEAQLDIRGNLKLNGLVMPHIIAGYWRMTGADPSVVTIDINEGNCVTSIPNSSVSGFGSGISGNRGRFTAPVTGLYHVSATINHATRTTSNYLGTMEQYGGAITTSWPFSYAEIMDLRMAENVEESYTFTKVAKMDAGDSITFQTHSIGYIDGSVIFAGSVYLIYAIPSATW